MRKGQGYSQMQAVDLQGHLAKYLQEEDRVIPKTHLYDVCKFKQEGACRYVLLHTGSFVCTKKTPMKESLDEIADGGRMQAIGDNCEGLGTHKKS